MIQNYVHLEAKRVVVLIHHHWLTPFCNSNDIISWTVEGDLMLGAQPLISYHVNRHGLIISLLIRLGC